jgi:hypothetical protein
VVPYEYIGVPCSSGGPLVFPATARRKIRCELIVLWIPGLRLCILETGDGSISLTGTVALAAVLPLFCGCASRFLPRFLFRPHSSLFRCPPARAAAIQNKSEIIPIIYLTNHYLVVYYG